MRTIGRHRRVIAYRGENRDGAMIVATLCFDILLYCWLSMTHFKNCKNARNVFRFSCGNSKHSTDIALYWSGGGISGIWRNCISIALRLSGWQSIWCGTHQLFGRTNGQDRWPAMVWVARGAIVWAMHSNRGRRPVAESYLIYRVWRKSFVRAQHRVVRFFVCCLQHAKCPPLWFLVLANCLQETKKKKHQIKYKIKLVDRLASMLT